MLAVSITVAAGNQVVGGDEIQLVLVTGPRLPSGHSVDALALAEEDRAKSTTHSSFFPFSFSLPALE